jgi:hypothetical protein
LICWLAFGVGCEYLAKGVCRLNRLENTLQEWQETTVLDWPATGDIAGWTKAAPARGPTITRHRRVYAAGGVAVRRRERSS